jgi:RHS repeat-associated protein
MSSHGDQQISANNGEQLSSFNVTSPKISLPKGGGAMRGIGEKFSANAATGTGSMPVPLPISPARGGFQPKLSIDYDSGSGNGVFGLGWKLSLPVIARKTDKGLPRYLDNSDSDVFVMAEAEDLVPAVDTATGRRLSKRVRWAGRDYDVLQFRPRIESLFALIEKWTESNDPAECFWRIVDRTNVTQWYGLEAESRIADPTHPERIFQWLPSESYDDRGNAIVYEYLPDDGRGASESAPHEVQRTPLSRSAQRYLKRILYGNRRPYIPTLSREEPTTPKPNDWLFELVFDYGDHSGTPPDRMPDIAWPIRPDAFSNYRPGFELRTSRRCERVLMYHHFPEATELAANGLVRSMRFKYDDVRSSNHPSQASHSVLISVESSAYQAGEGGAVTIRALPPMEFSYSTPVIDTVVRRIEADRLVGLPAGLQGHGYHWVDLDGEGISGVLAEDTGTWRYAANLGGGRFGPSRPMAPVPARRALSTGRQQLMDLGSDGEIDVVELDGPVAGFYERGETEWKRFVPFESMPKIKWDDPNLRFVDLTGDGHADALITEDDVLVWCPSLTKRGFGAAEWSIPPPGEEGTRLVFADGTQTLFLADMCGDGLTDIVRIRNGEACYWPNLGYGQFGKKVSLGNAPRFDFDGRFDPRRIRLADIDGSGPTDIIYLGAEAAQLYFNRSGNTLSNATAVPFPTATANLDAVQVADLLGLGTACLVWNSHLPADAAAPVRYIDLTGGKKPWLLTGVRNNLGGSTEIEYTPSTSFYLADKATGTPWITRLPFPVHCVSRVTVRDAWRGTEFSSTYSYHHGYYDGEEREFRGFGRVEQVDIEDYGHFAQGNAGSPWITEDRRLFQPPVKTVTWYHTGLTDGRHRVLSHFAQEYFPARYRFDNAFRERGLPEPVLDPGLDPEEYREALRACKGMVLRQEIYELEPVAATSPDARHGAKRLYSAATHNCRIKRLQARGGNRHAVFLVTESEAISYNYELALPERGGAVAPDPRIAHTLTLRIDEQGNALQTVQIGYPRIGQFAEDGLDAIALSRIRAVQAERHMSYAETQFTNDAIQLVGPGANAAIRHYRLRSPCEARTYELAGIAHAEPFYFRPEDFERLELSDHYPPIAATGSLPVEPLPYHHLPNGDVPQRRLVEHARTLYFDDASDETAPSSPLPLGQMGPRGLKYEDYKLALTDELLSAVFRAPAIVPDKPSELLDWDLQPGITARDLLNDSRRSGYIRGEELAGQYWLRSGIAGFAEDAARHFFLPERYTDPFGAVTTLEYDPLDLYIRGSTDARSNRSEVLRFDFRVLAPVEMMDANGNRTEVCFDTLGLVIASAANGKPVEGGWEGDDLRAFAASLELRDPGHAEVQAFSAATALDEAKARHWLARASSRFVYHFGETRDAEGNVTAWWTRPAMACAIAREVRASSPGGDASPLQIGLECSDGAGGVLMKKQQAEPETDGGPLRWIVNGLTVLNNKGKPVKQYEPSFSNRFGCEMPRDTGVTPIMYYDAAGRLMRTDAPDGTFSRVEVSPWHARQFDAGDTVLESQWYAERMTGAASPEDRRAARLSALHANTPALTVLDSLGRDAVAIAHNRSPSDAIEWRNTPLADRPWLDERYLTFTRMDAEDKPLWVRDARGNLVMQYIHPPKPSDDPGDALPEGSVPTYDIAGNLLFQHGMDGGSRWTLSDAAGKPFAAWDVNDRLDDAGVRHIEPRLAHTEYDILHRPVRQWLRLGDALPAVVERFDYRDTADPGPSEARARNLIGQAVRHDDPGGRMELLSLDFTGQVQHERRRLARHTTAPAIDWQGDDAAREALLEAETFTRLTEHDALGRMTRLVNWHRSGERVAVYRPSYNARGALEAEDLTIGARLTPGGPEGGQTHRAVHGIRNDAKGQRQRLRHGNGTETRYHYDPLTFRLVQLRTTRPAADLEFPGYHSNLRDERVVQQLNYTYDANGNIAGILDEAWAPVFFRNQSVDPNNLYVYDALNRLIEAAGRESAKLSSAPGPVSEAIGVASFPADHALRNYVQRYRYDAVGNFQRMQHVADGGGWTRHYETAADSNRLLRTWIGGDEANAVRYAYDIHGSMLNLANVPDAMNLRWDWRDMIESLDLGGGGRAHYAYDIGKQRTRKRIERQNGALEERLYLGGMELYRRHSPSGEMLEHIESHHLFVDDQRVLLVDDVIETDNSRLGTGVLLRYQYGNHLGSVGLELDELAAIVSHEEFHPYGASAFHVTSASTRSTAKRYKHTGMERDKESGLGYHSARYYIISLARWSTCDPKHIIDGLNIYSYANNSPSENVDPNGTDVIALHGGGFGEPELPSELANLVAELITNGHPNQIPIHLPTIEYGTSIFTERPAALPSIVPFEYLRDFAQEDLPNFFVIKNDPEEGVRLAESISHDETLRYSAQTTDPRVLLGYSLGGDAALLAGRSAGGGNWNLRAIIGAEVNERFVDNLLRASETSERIIVVGISGDDAMRNDPEWLQNISSELVGQRSYESIVSAIEERFGSMEEFRHTHPNIAIERSEAVPHAGGASTPEVLDALRRGYESLENIEIPELDSSSAPTSTQTQIVPADPNQIQWRYDLQRARLIQLPH